MSDNILKDLYNRLLNLFKQTEQTEENVKEVAKNRLRVVLMQDRTNLTPELLQRMRKELVDLLSKYVEMDKEALELNFDQEGDQMALMLSIPVIRAKDEEEIQKVLDEEDAKKAALEEEASEEEEEETSEEESEQAGEDGEISEEINEESNNDEPEKAEEKTETEEEKIEEISEENEEKE